MELSHPDFLCVRDRHDWFEAATTRRRNCWFVMRDGNPGCSIDDVMSWPISRVRQACSDIIFLIEREAKAASRG